jgi:hypothetical protein
MIARVGRTRVWARLTFAQMAQKSPARPVGVFCGGDGGASAEAFPLRAAAPAGEPPLSRPTCTWPITQKLTRQRKKRLSLSETQTRTY